MIVTCESCKSRYKLDDAKITGRGAKITCPKCTNVFVVYAQAEAADASAPRGMPAAATTGKTAPWQPKKSGGLADAVKAADRGIAPGRTEASAAPVGPQRMRLAATSDWDDEPTRIGSPLPSPEEMLAEVARYVAANADASAPPAPAANGIDAGPSADPAAMAARAASLDFRKVGVTTWKVKVKIGLIYDFSDIKTLRKYIQDGRVTAADVVSWDGKVWRAIGEIPDLDAFFIETWDMLAVRKSQPPTLNPAPPGPEDPARAEELAEELAGPSPARTDASRADAPRPDAPRNGGEPDRFMDPFAELKKKQRERVDQRRTGSVGTPSAPRKANAPGTGSSRAPHFALALLAVLAVGGGAAWWMNQPPVPVEPLAPPVPPQATKTPDQIRDEINEKLQRSLEAPTQEAPKKTPGGAADAVVTGAGTDRAPLPLTPDRPPDRSRVPEGAVAKNPRGGLPGGSNLKQADQTAADHEAVGDDAARGGDWSTAAIAYKKAVALDPNNARLAGKLGRALFEGEDYSNAQPALDRAARAGTKEAYKFLGHIARLQGDTALANSQYQLYLKGSPRDAAEIEQIIATMSGG